jgi:putative ABC transport system permease protein
VRALFSQTAADREFDSEAHLHIHLLTERYVHQGLSPAEARLAALRQFGAATQLKEDLREQRSLMFFENLLQDARYALRQFRKSPVFCLTAVLTLALGIGINTAVFSVIYVVLLRPLPYTNGNQLTIVWEQNVRRGWYHNIVSAANFNDWSKENHVFSDMALIDPAVTFNLTGGGFPLEVRAERVTPNLFSVLGVQPFLGRSFLPEEGHPGSARVVILGHALWARQYGSDRSIVGRQIALNSENYTVIGVMPAGFRADYSRRLGTAAQIWVSALDRSDPERTAHNYIAIGRLRPGVTLQRAQAEMDTIAGRLQARYPDNKDWGVGLVSLHDELVGDSRPALLILLAAVALVLMIACANLANLLLARGAVRRRELAVRRALGAGRSRLLAQLLTESFLLSALGAAIGLWVASAGVKGLLAIAPVDTPGIESAGLQTLVLIYAAALALLTTMLFGVVPALGISNSNLNNGLKDSSRSSTEGNRAGRLRKVFVSAEFSIALVLAVSAGLMVKTLVYMHHVELGFQPDRVLTVRVPLNDVKYKENQQSEFYRALLARLRAVPDIESASVSRGIPFFGWAGQGFVTEENPKPAVSEMPDANVVEVGPQYFKSLRISLLRGRVFTEDDRAGRLPVAVVNEALARKEWPGENPLGKRIRIEERSPWLTIVGVTGNVRTEGPDADLLPEIYMCYLQHPWILTPRNLLIRTHAANPLSVLPSVRNVIHELDPDQPIADVRTLNAVVEDPLALRSFLAYLLGGFALLALALAAIGVYGVMAYTVAQRLREIGIRMALGASRQQVVRYIVRDGLQIGAIGLLIGLIGSIAATRLLSTQLFGVKATDPQIFVTVFLLLAAIAVCAAYLPARRATRIDPLSVLRDE